MVQEKEKKIQKDTWLNEFFNSGLISETALDWLFQLQY